MLEMLFRIAKFLLGGLIALAALFGALFYYFIATPEPEPPALAGLYSKASLEHGGRARSYRVYVPKSLSSGAPIVFALHGSGQSGERIRIETGYAFDRLADRNGFIIVYPDAFEGYWNACNIEGAYSANALDVDDVGFLIALRDRVAADHGANADRAFAVGVSRGGQMAFRLAIEAPAAFRAVAAVAANIPTPDNFKCEPAREGVTSVMIMNGTADPLNPFDGGEVALYGFYRRGAVLSSEETARYFVRLFSIPDAPRRMTEVSTPRVEGTQWLGEDGREVDLIAVVGGGHVLPQPYRRAPRLLGPTFSEIDGPALIRDFFARRS